MDRYSSSDFLSDSSIDSSNLRPQGKLVYSPIPQRCIWKYCWVIPSPKNQLNKRISRTLCRLSSVPISTRSSYYQRIQDSHKLIPSTWRNSNSVSLNFNSLLLYSPCRHSYVIHLVTHRIRPSQQFGISSNTLESYRWFSSLLILADSWILRECTLLLHQCKHCFQR